MRGHIRQRGDTWELRAYVGRDPVTGRKKYLTRTFRGGKWAAEEALTKFVVEVGGEVVVDSAGAVRVVGWRVSYAMGPLEMKARIAEMNAERHDVPAIRVRSSTKVGTPDGRPTRPDKGSVGQLT
jgi:hypothetical protein